MINQGLKTLSRFVRAFNFAAVNYIMEREYRYSSVEHDANGLRLEQIVFESSYLAKKIIEHYSEDDAFLEGRFMISQRFYDFYFLSEALISCAEDKGNEPLEFFCIEKLCAALDEVHDIAYDGIRQIRKIYD